MPRQYRCEYKYTITHCPEHVWTVIGAKGALHLHISEADSRAYGGLEIHWRHPPEGRKNECPTVDHCWLLKAPCWHDGSSLIVDEVWLPRWRAFPHEHDKMFDYLKLEAAERFEQDDED